MVVRFSKETKLVSRFGVGIYFLHNVIPVTRRGSQGPSLPVAHFVFSQHEVIFFKVREKTAPAQALSVDLFQKEVVKQVVCGCGLVPEPTRCFLLVADFKSH